jgi:hypothetical protein
MDAYAESIGREFEVEDEEECLGRELIAGVSEEKGNVPLVCILEAPSVEPSMLEANSRSTSSSSLRFRAGRECILTSKSRSFAKCVFCAFSYFRSLAFNFLFSMVRSSITLR